MLELDAINNTVCGCASKGRTCDYIEGRADFNAFRRSGMHENNYGNDCNHG